MLRLSLFQILVPATLWAGLAWLAYCVPNTPIVLASVLVGAWSTVELARLLFLGQQDKAKKKGG